ncbi:MAG: YbaY family lipoprotein [Rhizobiales bacterium]|nr:YbaY family lipoprotein [Hyphomicrobiales bacterium]
MIKKFIYICLSLILVACSASLKPNGSNTIVAGDYVAISGDIFYHIKITLPEQVKIVIRLEEHAIADVSAAIIATKTIYTNGKQVPISFNMMVPKVSLDAAISPGFTVLLYHQNRLIFINKSNMPYKENVRQLIKVDQVY